LNGKFELLHAVRFATQQADRQRADVFREFFLQHSQRRVFHRRHQHPLAIGQVMADDVGNGVGLAGARRALHHHTIVHFQQLDDLHLLVVVGLGEIQFVDFSRWRIAALGATDVGQTAKRWQDYVFQHAGRLGQDRLQGWREIADCLYLAFKTGQVFNKHVAVANTGKKAPGICHAQVLTGLGHAAIAFGNRHRHKLPLGIEQ